MKNLLSAIAAVSVFAVAAPGVYAQDDSLVQFDTGVLLVETGEAQQRFDIEIADSPEETSQGMMFRESLAENAGMLFDFGEPREPAMWMKNTLIPLDMLFIDQNGIIVAIARNAQPHSERRITPGMPVKGVLELNGGAAGKFGIEPGDVVRHEIFNNLITEE